MSDPAIQNVLASIQKDFEEEIATQFSKPGRASHPLPQVALDERV
jgi:hypothetical protein